MSSRRDIELVGMSITVSLLDVVRSLPPVLLRFWVGAVDSYGGDRPSRVEEWAIVDERTNMLAMLAVAGIGLASNVVLPPDVPPPNPKAVQEVEAGKRKVANAAWWGFDVVDATTALQAAINSGARKVVVPNVGRDWVVDPISLRSDQEIVLEHGVTIAARKGGFAGLNDCLLKADRKRNLVIRGYGATLRMNKPEYTKGEWRHCLELDSCANVKVLGITLRDSGGDGIYIGNSDPKQPFCRDVFVRDCVMENNRRQGMSVITAVNLRVERCVFRDTGGTAPRAGVDLEPNEPVEKLRDCVFRDCRMENSEGPGILVYLGQLNGSTEPLSVRFERCSVSSVKGSGIEVGGTRRDAPAGLITFANCTVRGCWGAGLNVFAKSSDAVRLRFDHCAWRNVSIGNPKAPPLQLHGWQGASDPTVGGVEFVGCSVEDDWERPVIGVNGGSRTGAVAQVRGQITVNNPHGARMDMGAAALETSVEIRRRR